MLTPPISLQFSGPVHQPRNLLFRYVTRQIRRGESGIRRVSSAESEHKG
jgi:hypothetical protein